MDDALDLDEAAEAEAAAEVLNDSLAERGRAPHADDVTPTTVPT